MENKTHNGWTNRATWVVNLWIGDELSDKAQEGMTIKPDDAENLVQDLVGQTTNTVEDAFATDLIMLALSEVNWEEIADAAREG
jgi:hypothetical protein